MQRICLTIARFALAAWVGAAALFVINGVRLITSDAFGSIQRDHLSLIRFPTYYLFGFALVGLSLGCLLFVRDMPRLLVMGLVAAALLVMLGDYFAVYRPLAEMITPPGKPRTPTFETYHRASMIINLIHVGLCFGAFLALSRPLRPRSRSDG